MESLTAFILLFPIFMVAVVVHEVSHGWVALRLGDSTALEAGRLTFNPFRHIDPFGTLFLPILLVLLRSPFVFGWAKPVPVNASNLRHPRRDMLWVGAAGPLANLGLAVFIALLVRFLAAVGAPPWVISYAKVLVLINLVLGIFNLVPIPPLDGSRILTGLLPFRFLKPIVAAERWGIVLLMILLYLGVVNKVLWPVVEVLAQGLGIQ